jgi:hypothetical protein
VICVRGLANVSPLRAASVHALCLAAEELGVDSFVDLNEFPDDDVGDSRVRMLLESLLHRQRGYAWT